MKTREECLAHLINFIESGDIEQVASAAGIAIAYLATLNEKSAQLAALARLQRDLADQCETRSISGHSEDRHVAIEDALMKARATLESV